MFNFVNGPFSHKADLCLPESVGINSYKRTNAIASLQIVPKLLVICIMQYRKVI